MSLSDRRAILFGLAALPLAGCGFEPVYREGGAADGLQGRILVAAPKDRDSFALANRLEDRIGRADAPLYDLKYEAVTRRNSLGITDQQEITRYNVSGTVTFSLTSRSSGAVVHTDTVSSFTSYSATANTIATLAAERDAYKRLMVILADQIVTRLVASSGSWAK